MMMSYLSTTSVLINPGTSYWKNQADSGGTKGKKLGSRQFGTAQILMIFTHCYDDQDPTEW